MIMMAGDELSRWERMKKGRGRDGIVRERKAIG